MKNISVNIVSIFLLLAPLKLSAQDFHLSQYDAAALNVNPALTGLFRGNIRVHGHYRNQCLAMIAVDFNNGNWGVGGQIANFRAGIGGYDQFSIMPSVAYRKKLGATKKHTVSGGLQVGFFQKTVNAASLSFASQYVETDGGGFFSSIPSGENLGGNSIINLDMNIGGMYHYADRFSRLNPFGGFTLYHFNRPKESFFGESNRLPMRLQLQFGSRISITELLSVTPKVYVQMQKKVEEVTFGFLGQYYLKNPNFFLMYGMTYRSKKDAAIIEVGAKYGNFEGRINYDINLSALTSISNGRGASEFSLTYIFNREKKYPLEKCPKIQ